MVYRIHLTNPTTLQLRTREVCGSKAAHLEFGATVKEVRENRQSAGWVGPVKAMLVSPRGYLLQAFGSNY